MIDKMALDLGIYRFADEPLPLYKSRVVYSAMSCWIKTIALDRKARFMGSVQANGVSRRHIHDRSSVVLDMLVKMFPEIGKWFFPPTIDENPVNLIRTRLINHGDLLNAGFETNLALSSVHADQISTSIETVYGKTIDKTIQYAGVSTVRYKKADNYHLELKDVQEWLQSFLEEAWWSHDLPDADLLQYFDSYSTTKNNYSAWGASPPNHACNVILARTMVNRNSYFYYLIKPKSKLVHKIDPFLQDLGFHIRVICALRSYSNNRTEVKVTQYQDHVKAKFYSLLPLRERTMLESYAWPVRNIDDDLEWVMAFSIWDYIRPYLEALGIQVKEEKYGQL